MKHAWLLILTVFICAIAAIAKAKEISRRPIHRPARHERIIRHEKTKNNVSRDIRFSSMDVNGKYHVPTEGDVTVGEHRQPVELLHMRMDFKDRLKREMGRR